MMRASVMPFHLHYLYKILLMSISVHLSRKRACFMKQHRMKARLPGGFQAGAEMGKRAKQIQPQLVQAEA